MAENTESRIITQVDGKYLNVRSKAHQLDTELEQAEKQYQREAISLIKKLQQKFYNAYGDKIHELEDLQDAINQYQKGGLKKLKRQLQKIYLEEVGDNDDFEGEGDGVVTISKNVQEKAKRLYEEYRAQYCPDDAYQRKKDREAARLQKSILGGSKTDDRYNMLMI